MNLTKMANHHSRSHGSPFQSFRLSSPPCFPLQNRTNLQRQSPLIEHREKAEKAKSNPITGVMNHMCPPGNASRQVRRKKTTTKA